MFSIYGALENAARIGIGITEFWTLTPRELSIYIDAYIERIKHDEDNHMVYAYVGAYLQRVKNMPALEKFLEKTEDKEQAPEDMLESLKKLNASLGGNVY